MIIRNHERTHIVCMIDTYPSRAWSLCFCLSGIFNLCFCCRTSQVKSLFLRVRAHPARLVPTRSKYLLCVVRGFAETLISPRGTICQCFIQRIFCSGCIYFISSSHALFEKVLTCHCSHVHNAVELSRLIYIYISFTSPKPKKSKYKKGYIYWHAIIHQSCSLSSFPSLVKIRAHHTHFNHQNQPVFKASLQNTEKEEMHLTSPFYLPPRRITKPKPPSPSPQTRPPWQQRTHLPQKHPAHSYSTPPTISQKATIHHQRG